MAKFLNKKEQVFDIKLTSYGNYLLSIGKFKPIYYEFFDDNVLYDGRYGMYTGSNAPEKSNAGVVLRENQNLVHKRIKEETQYLESLVLFEEVENNIAQLSGDTYDADETPTQTSPRIDIYKSNQGIGDAFLEGGSQNMPAWKVVSLQGEISSSTKIDPVNGLSRIPQINISLNYKKQIKDLTRIEDRVVNPNPQSVGDLTNTTRNFVDGYAIEFVTDHSLMYFEEANTTLLTKNYDIEVFDRTFTESEFASAPFEILEVGTPIYDAAVTINDGTTSVAFTFKNGATDSTHIEAGDVSGADGKTTLAERLVTVINNCVLDSSTSLKVGASSNGADVTITNLNCAPLNGSFTNTENSGARITTSDSSDIDPWTGGIFTGGKDGTETLERKYFEDNIEQIVDGMMVSSQPQTRIYDKTSLSTGSVGYYFDILRDEEIVPEIACRGAAVFNRSSYYVDLDFDCDSITSPTDAMYNDIYGIATEPEICQD